MPAPEHLTLVSMFEELHGDRVLVRPFRPEDAPLVHEAISESRDHIRPWLPWADGHQSVEETLEWINRTRADWILRKNMFCAMFDAAEPGRFVGGVGLHPRDWEVPYFEIGYWVRVSATRRGYVTEAVRLLTRFGQEELGARRMEIRCDERNTPSANVARRAGYVYEGTKRSEMLDTEGNPFNMMYFSLVPGDNA